MITAGFAERGGEGAALQHELLGICREAGMRLIGPNCLGVINTAADVRLDATFAEHPPPPGPIGFLSQSGGLGIAIIEAAGRMGLGLSSFVSVGNKADVSGNDLLEYWERDPGTSVVLLYLESFGNPRRFARIARRVAAAKPIVAVKSGRSPAGARASASHTGALLSSSDVTVDALFAQAGVIRTDTMQELFDVGALLSTQPVPAGCRVAIVTNAGGPGILCADACQAAGLEVVELPAELRERLAAELAPEASVANPIDMIATAPAADYGRVIGMLAGEHACDAIVAIFVPPLVTRAEDVAAAIRGAASTCSEVAIASVFMNSGGAPDGDEDEAHVPSFSFPEDAARALGAAARYGSWRKRPAGLVPRLAGCRGDEAAAIIARSLAAGGGWMAPADVLALLDCYGLELLPTRVLATPAAAAAAAAELGGEVALKAVAEDLLHKSDAGGVRLHLEGEAAVLAAAREIERSVLVAGHRLEGLIVQPMAGAGVELLMGVVHDPSFGPVIACGAGGTSVELLGDVAVRITPLTDARRERDAALAAHVRAARGLSRSPPVRHPGAGIGAAAAERARGGAPGGDRNGRQPGRRGARRRAHRGRSCQARARHARAAAAVARRGAGRRARAARYVETRIRPRRSHRWLLRGPAVASGTQSDPVCERRFRRACSRPASTAAADRASSRRPSCSRWPRSARVATRRRSRASARSAPARRSCPSAASPSTRSARASP